MSDYSKNDAGRMIGGGIGLLGGIVGGIALAAYITSFSGHHPTQEQKDMLPLMFVSFPVMGSVVGLMTGITLGDICDSSRFGIIDECERAERDSEDGWFCRTRERGIIRLGNISGPQRPRALSYLTSLLETKLEICPDYNSVIEQGGARSTIWGLNVTEKVTFPNAGGKLKDSLTYFVNVGYIDGGNIEEQIENGTYSRDAQKSIEERHRIAKQNNRTYQLILQNIHKLESMVEETH